MHGRAGRIVDGEQQGEARAALLEPGMMAAVDLEQHPLAGRPLTPDAVLGRPADPRLAAVVVDRLTFRAHIIETGTESYRLRITAAAKGGAPTN